MSHTAAELNALEAFNWKQQPEAAALVNGLVENFIEHCPAANALAARMKDEAGTRFVDWVDTIFLPGGERVIAQLKAVGYEPEPNTSTSAGAVWWQPQGVFPRIVLQDAKSTRVLLKVDSVATFLATNDIQARIDGEPLGQMRVSVFVTGDYELGVVERHGYRGYDLPKSNPDKAVLAQRALDAFRMRKRDFNNDEEAFRHAEDLVDAYIKVLGRDWVCDLWFEAERQFWMKRNKAAQVQYARQQKLGMGWANHDHHTYRSSRKLFVKLVAFWEKLGFACRERYHAGLQAGWGAQVMEHGATGITTFNDVDLSPEELFNDFAHEPIAERPNLGTVGLWCGLHGDSFVQAGMHHLECMFDFDALRDQLAAEEGIETMNPFTNFSYLRQAFTKGERWKVKENRIQKLLQANLIDEGQAGKFRADGAIGSHLENLERNDGFKGFNQKGVSEIISATDPRKQVKQLA